MSRVNPTVAQYLRGWLDDQRDRCKPSTWKGRRSQIVNYVIPTLGGRHLDELTSEDVSLLFEELLAGGGRDGAPLAPSTVAGAGCTLRAALDDAVDQDLMAHNAAREVSLPRATHLRDRTAEIARNILSVEQVQRFLDAIYDDPHRDLWVVAIGTGLRRGELIGLRWSDVDLDAGKLHVARALRDGDEGPWLEDLSGAQVRTLVIDGFVQDTLRWRRAVSDRQRQRAGGYWDDRWDLVFAGPEGRPLELWAITAHFARLVERLDVPRVRLHDVRHTHAALLLQAGIAITAVSERLGHTSVATTLDAYAELLPRDDAKMAVRFARLVYPDRQRAVTRPPDKR